MTQDRLDALVIGASAAGVAASIYLARRKLNFKLISQDLGGEVAKSGLIENYPGFVKTDGIALTELFRQQLEANQVKPELGLIVSTITAEPASQSSGPTGFRVKATRASEPIEYRSRVVIVATGVHPRQLAVPGETDLRNKGVSYCTVCDGPLFRAKTVAVVGGGNSALESIIMMSSLARKVYSINLNPEFKGEQVLIDQVKKLKNVELISRAATKRITGQSLVDGLEYTDQNGQTKRITDLQGIFIHIGFIPNSLLVKELGVVLDNYNQIKIDRLGRTSLPGVFAAGDVTDLPYQQIGIAVGEGIIAALSAIGHLDSGR